jgi:hypothetical protein
MDDRLLRRCQTNTKVYVAIKSMCWIRSLSQETAALNLKRSSKPGLLCGNHQYEKFINAIWYSLERGIDKILVLTVT